MGGLAGGAPTTLTVVDFLARATLQALRSPSLVGFGVGRRVSGIEGPQLQVSVFLVDLVVGKCYEHSLEIRAGKHGVGVIKSLVCLRWDHWMIIASLRGCVRIDAGGSARLHFPTLSLVCIDPDVGTRLAGSVKRPGILRQSYA